MPPKTSAASSSQSSKGYEDYFVANDGQYRTFRTACKAGIQKGPAFGPTGVQLHQALVGMEDEDNLPDEWSKYAEAHPVVALTLRREAAGLLTSTGEKVKLNLPEDTKIFSLFRTPLIVWNPKYKNGVYGFNPKDKEEKRKLHKVFDNIDTDGQDVSASGRIKRQRQISDKPRRPRKKAATSAALVKQEDDDDDDVEDLVEQELEAPPQGDGNDQMRKLKQKTMSIVLLRKPNRFRMPLSLQTLR